MQKTCVFVLVLFLFACDSRKEVSPEAAGPTPARAAEKSAEVPDPKEERVGAIEEADLDALLDSWLKSQNTGDFNVYSSHYAEKFNGVKRSGPKLSTFGREGWLKDRERMFSKKMEVSAAEVEYAIAGQSAGIRFEQTWASGDYKDVGPKQLSVVRTNDGLKIAREEMLASTLVGEEVALPPYNPGEIALLLSENQVVLTLDDGGVKVSKPSLKSVYGISEAEVTDPGKLGSYVGAEVQVHMEKGPPCHAKVKSLSVVARITPHFGQVQSWQGEMGGAHVSDAEIAKDIWSLADGARVVVGNLDTSCKGHFAIVPATDREPGLLEFDIPEGLKELALKAFRALPAHEVLQKEYNSQKSDKKPWDTEINQFKAFGGHSGEIEYIAVLAEAGAGCGDFGGSLWAIFQISPSGTLVLLTDPKSPGESFIPTSAAMIGGEVIFVSKDVAVRKLGTVWHRTHEARTPYYDCPC